MGRTLTFRSWIDVIGKIQEEDPLFLKNRPEVVPYQDSPFGEDPRIIVPQSS